MIRSRIGGKRVFLTGAKGNLGPLWREWLEEYECRVFCAGLPEYDLTDADQRQSAVDACMDAIGVPELVIHNAAIDNPPGSQASFFGNADKILSVNLLAAAHLTDLLLPPMVTAYNFDFNDIPRNIVFIGSMLGFVASNPDLYPPGFDKPFAYGAAKAGLWNLCKALNMRYAKRGVVSNMLALSAVEGGQSEEFKQKYIQRIPIKRMLQPDDFKLEFYAACASRVPWGEPLLVCGGYTIC